jgi:hypothetical protein
MMMHVLVRKVIHNKFKYNSLRNSEARQLFPNYQTFREKIEKSDSDPAFHESDSLSLDDHPVTVYFT